MWYMQSVGSHRGEPRIMDMWIEIWQTRRGEPKGGFRERTFTVHSVVTWPKEVMALLEDKGPRPVWPGENRERRAGTEWGDALLAIVRIWRFFVNVVSPSENFKQKDGKIYFIILKQICCLLYRELIIRRVWIKGRLLRVSCNIPW